MTEKRFWLVPINYDGEQRFVRDKKLIGEKSMSNQEVVDKLNELTEENEQLKKELTKFKEWEKYVGDIKREELDRVFKMSIYEITEGFEYYQERIKELENEMKK